MKLGYNFFFCLFQDFSNFFILQLKKVKQDPAATKKFLEDNLHFKYAQRKQGYVMLDEKDIQDGDSLAIAKFNKEEAGIMLLSSSRTGHSAMFSSLF